MKWEICSTRSWDETKALSAAGWELVSVMAVYTDNNSYVEKVTGLILYYFKRGVRGQP